MQNKEASPHPLVKTLIGLVICMGFFTGIYFVASDREKNELAEQTVVAKEESTFLPQSTPPPFAELTIPYLRKQSYQSNLGELDIIRETTTYTAYLTSYSSEGLRINGLLTQPKGTQPENGWPAIVFVHGYIPPAQYKTDGQYAAFVDYLARNGFVVFKVDLRGHASSEGEPSGAYYSSDYIIDVLHAYSALQNSDFVNPDGIGLWGHSMAGNVVLRSLAVEKEIPVAVIWAGAVYSYEDFQEFGISDASYQAPPNQTERQRKRKELFDTYGEFTPESPFWKQVAATNYLTDFQGAVQLHHAINDDVVDVRYSRNLTELLDETQVEHELHEYSSGGHNISGSSFTQAMQGTVEFYKNKLP